MIICDVRLTKVKYKPLCNFSLVCIMDNKFVSRDTLRKRKARENETPSQHNNRLAKQRETYKQRKAEESKEEREARAARDRERKRIRLETETKEQRQKRLSRASERKEYLKNVQNTIDQVDQDLDSQRQNLQGSGADGADTRDQDLQNPQQEDHDSGED